MFVRLWLLTFLFALNPGGSATSKDAAQSPSEKWVLSWSDEFNGANNSPVDAAKWNFDIGGDGWGNHELEYYTNRLQNAHQEKGHLVITARKENYTGPDGVAREYTSARLLTLNKFSQKYGRFEARIKIPYGQGLWPAFWMLGDNMPQVDWPAAGEIDIFENIGVEPFTIHGTIHGPGYVNFEGLSSPYSLPNRKAFYKNYHLYAVEWEPNAIRFYVDKTLYRTMTPADLPTGTTWVFDHPFFILLNVAVGGDWPGRPDRSTVIPQTMLVDYVRVYRR